jgi:hypothetical protein
VNVVVPKRLIAALLLLNLMSWANSAAYCLSGLGRMAPHTSRMMAANSHAQHSCCPHDKATTKTHTLTALAICHQGHNCCFVQNPQIPSNLPEGPTMIGQVIHTTHEIFIAAISAGSATVQSFETFQPYSSFSTILRV